MLPEPAQLRVQTRTQIADLQHLQRRPGITQTMGARMAVMKTGRLQQFDSPTEVKVGLDTTHLHPFDAASGLWLGDRAG
jgi:ABC-type sugar transport system ATPase subunit